jgi:hypothetical protein
VPVTRSIPSLRKSRRNSEKIWPCKNSNRQPPNGMRFADTSFTYTGPSSSFVCGPKGGSVVWTGVMPQLNSLLRDLRREKGDLNGGE